MKALLLSLALLSLVVSAASHAASCEIIVKSKTLSTAGAKIGDVSFSKKQLDALSSVCNVKRSTLSTDDLLKLEEISYQKRIAKLKASKT